MSRSVKQKTRSRKAPPSARVNASGGQFGGGPDTYGDGSSNPGAGTKPDAPLPEATGKIQRWGK